MENFQGKLILCSSGAFNAHKTNEKELLQEQMYSACAKNKNVLVVLNASDTGSNPLGKMHTAEAFYKFGAKSVTAKSISKNDFDSFSNYDLIYFMGGDCLPLITLANTNGIKPAIINFLKSNKTIIGQSAGTLFFTKNLKYYYEAKKGTKPKYDIPLKTYAGLAMVEEIFFPHYDKQPESELEKIKSVEKQNNITFTKLNDGDYFVYSLSDLNIQ